MCGVFILFVFMGFYEDYYIFWDMFDKLNYEGVVKVVKFMGLVVWLVVMCVMLFDYIV